MNAYVVPALLNLEVGSCFSVSRMGPVVVHLNLNEDVSITLNTYLEENHGVAYKLLSYLYRLTLTAKSSRLRR